MDEQTFNKKRRGLLGSMGAAIVVSFVIFIVIDYGTDCQALIDEEMVLACYDNKNWARVFIFIVIFSSVGFTLTRLKQLRKAYELSKKEAEK